MQVVIIVAVSICHDCILEAGCSDLYKFYCHCEQACNLVIYCNRDETVRCHIVVCCHRELGEQGVMRRQNVDQLQSADRKAELVEMELASYKYVYPDVWKYV